MNEILGSGLLTAGLVDLDGSLLIQLIVFGIFFLVLNMLVVKPMIAAHDARYEKMEGARKEAQSTDLRAARARVAASVRCPPSGCHALLCSLLLALRLPTMETPI